MDEDEYRKTYQQVNEIRCIFEKALCSLRCCCSKSKPFRLADRTCYGCHSKNAQKQCTDFLNKLRNQTRFVFKINEINGPLPHNKEIRVQNGGLMNSVRSLRSCFNLAGLRTSCRCPPPRTSLSVALWLTS